MSKHEAAQREKSAEPSSLTSEQIEAANEADSDFKKGAWTPEEDRLLSQLIEVFHTLADSRPLENSLSRKLANHLSCAALWTQKLVCDCHGCERAQREKLQAALV